MADQSSVTQDSASGQGWIHIAVPGAQLKNGGIGGPYSGEGAIQLLQAGVHLYPSQTAAKAADAQTLTAAQVQTLLTVGLEGPGIGQGFFGLGGDISQATHDISNPLSGLLEIGHWIGDLVSHLTDKYMWISLGWLILGLALVLLGVNLLFGFSSKFTAGLGGAKGSVAGAAA